MKLSHCFSLCRVYGFDVDNFVGLVSSVQRKRKYSNRLHRECGEYDDQFFLDCVHVDGVYLLSRHLKSRNVKIGRTSQSHCRRFAENLVGIDE